MFQSVAGDRYAVTGSFIERGSGAYSNASDLIALSGGGFAAVWYDNGAVHSQLFDNDGRPITGNSIVAGAGSEPSVAALNNGGYVVTWTQMADYPAGAEVHARIFGADGLPVSSDFVVNSTTPGFQQGSAFNDQLTGTVGADRLDGSDNADILAGGAGSDTINGNGGNDTIYAGDISPDWAPPGFNPGPWTAPLLDHGAEVDTLNGGAGLDRIYAGYGDNVDGGADDADLLISFAGASAGVTADFRALDNDGTMTVGGGLIQNIRSVLWIEGSNFDDTITGENTNLALFSTPIFGLGGNDHIIAGSGITNIFGGDGNDIIEAHAVFGFPIGGNYYGDAGDDVITVSSETASFPSVSVFGGEGNDTLTSAGRILGGAGNDTINVAETFSVGLTVAQGDEGDDIINGSGAGDSLYGGSGADVIAGNGANDTIASAGVQTSGGWDFVDRGSEHDVLSGGTGDDTIYAGYGDDVDGGTGINSLSLSLLGSSTGVILSAATLETGGAVQLGGGTIANIQHITQLLGSNFNDTLTLSGGIVVYGMGGDDTINGSSAADEIHGGAGADIIAAGGGDDLIVIDGIGDVAAGEQVNGGTGNDTLFVTVPVGDPADVSLAGVTLSGIETLKTFGATLGVTSAQLSGVTSLNGMFYFETAGAILLAGKDAPFGASFTLNDAGNQLDLTGFTATGFVIVAGSDAADRVIGSSQSDDIFANGGDDFIDGRGGPDNMRGGSGNDTYVVDSVGDGVGENSGEGTDSVLSSVSINQLFANVENLTLTGTANINGTGNALDNSIVGNSGSNVLNGGAGADTMAGGAGDDVYIVDSVGDIAGEFPGEGVDTVRSSVSFGLDVEVENLVLTGNGAISGTGNDLSNSIVGNAAANILSGRGGIDILTGGAGNDTFRDTGSALNGDTITDFTAGDKIIITDVDVASFTFSISGHALNYGGGSLTLTNVPAGHIVAQAAAGGGVQLSVVQQPVHNDFNGDGRSDLLLRNDNGFMSEWNGQSNGGFVGNANANYPLGNDWHVAGTGDFNGDGLSDLLLRNDNGYLGEWNGQANGSFVGNANVNYPLGNDWHIAGTGDFNGDGRSDLLLRNDNGSLAEWTGQSNGSFVGNVNVNYPLGNDWHVAGTGDFNGDGLSDLILRNDNGYLGEWNGQANGSFVGNASVNYALRTDFHVAATGDFNGDGIDDLLLRNDGGLLAEWNGQANGSFVGNPNVNIPLGLDWRVAGTGDFNGDGIGDLLLRNNNGTLAEWNGQSNGSFIGNANANYPLGNDWHVQDLIL